MANKLKLATERRKIALKGSILQTRARVATDQERIKRMREELNSMSPRKASASAPSAALPPLARIRG